MSVNLFESYHEHIESSETIGCQKHLHLSSAGLSNYYEGLRSSLNDSAGNRPAAYRFSGPVDGKHTIKLDVGFRSIVKGVVMGESLRLCGGKGERVHGSLKSSRNMKARILLNYAKDSVSGTTPNGVTNKTHD